jgi:hypothetical protein
VEVFGIAFIQRRFTNILLDKAMDAIFERENWDIFIL